MKVSLTTYLAAQNGITLKVLPDTEIELELLKGFGLHGQVAFEDGELRISFRFEDKEKKGTQ